MANNESVIDQLRKPKTTAVTPNVSSDLPGSPRNPRGSINPGASTTTAAPPQLSREEALKRQVAADPYPTVDPNASVGEHLSNLGQQVVRGVENVGRVGADALTRGLYDRNQADPAAARAKTEQASEELGTGGNLGIRTMASIPGRIFKGGGLLKAGIESGVSGGIDAYGHGGTPLDILWGTGTGFATGTGLSGAGQVIAAGARKIAQYPVGQTIKDAVTSFANRVGINPTTPSSVTQKFQNDAQVKFRQFGGNTYNPSHVGNVADQLDNTLLSDPVSKSASPGTNKIIQQFRKDIWDKATSGQPATADDIHVQIKKLGSVIDKGGFDATQAKQARDILTGSFAHLPTTNGVPSSAVVDQFNAANKAHGLFKNAESLENMNKNLSDYNQMPGPTAKKMAQDDPNFYNPEQKAALRDIGNTPSTAPAASTPFATGGGAVFGALTGHPIAGPLVGATYDAVKSLATPAAARRAVYNAYPAMTGKTVINPEEMLSESLKRMGIGAESAAGPGELNPIDQIPGSVKPWVAPYIYGP